MYKEKRIPKSMLHWFHCGPNAYVQISFCPSWMVGVLYLEKMSCKFAQCFSLCILSSDVLLDSILVVDVE